MADIFHETKVAKSRKARQCPGAVRPSKSMPWQGYGWRDGSQHGRESFHPECYVAMGEQAAEEGGFFLWSPGDFSRGRRCEWNCKMLNPTDRQRFALRESLCNEIESFSVRHTGTNGARRLFRFAAF